MLSSKLYCVQLINCFLVEKFHSQIHWLRFNCLYLSKPQALPGGWLEAKLEVEGANLGSESSETGVRSCWFEVHML